MNKKQAVISLSGGMDSSCLLAYLLNQKDENMNPEYESVSCFAFDYGQKHKVELKRAKKNVELMAKRGFNVSFEVINVKDVFANSGSSLTDSSKTVPTGHYADESMKSTVVPNRNVIFSAIIYSKALSISTNCNCDVDITLGIHAGDHTIYPDCRPESRSACANAFALSNWGSERVKYVSPFVDIDKGSVLDMGLQSLKSLGMSKPNIKGFFKNTHTCYAPNEKHEACGKCGSCTERLEAFADCGMVDPVKYVG